MARQPKLTPDLSGMCLAAINLSAIDFFGAALAGTDLHAADLAWADLSQTDLRGADLRWANLASALLRNADLTGADLSHSHARGADLSGADLHDTSLVAADLREADLVGASLAGADLTDANLRRTDLSGVRNLTQAQLDVACTDGHTRLPPGLRPGPQAPVLRVEEPETRAGMQVELYIAPQGHGQLGNQPVASLDEAITHLRALWARVTGPAAPEAE